MDFKRPKNMSKPFDKRPHRASDPRAERASVKSPTGKANRTLPSEGAVPAAGGAVAIIDLTVAGLGYELVDIERLPRGLLRVSIDRIPSKHYPSGESDCITVDDCELVTRQLQYVLEVGQIDYARLEVSSPGLDRPLRKSADWQRFSGQTIDLTLKLPFEGRKKYQGVLAETQNGWRVIFVDGKAEKALDFSLDEVREARLVAQVDFKGRRIQGGASQAKEAVRFPHDPLRPSQSHDELAQTGEKKQ